ncbi:MAG TPA: hypothetical protein VJQ82_00275 [Terriglobales bacterium]|nr:hypothetical protein [Terriglobales bacterium]
MKKVIAGAMLLVVALSWAPLSLAMVAAGSHHRCCHRMHLQISLPATSMCGSGRCCASSDRTTTLPAVSPAPRPDLAPGAVVQPVPVAGASEAVATWVSSPSRPCFDLSMVFRI